jgi:predicted phage baseplate assembly protein
VIDSATALDESHTRLVLTTELVNVYDAATVIISANIALSTHGETTNEVLGGGDASKAFQRFVLKQPPLTYISSSSAGGGQSTLEVRVNEILWHEVTDFYGHEPEERIYVTRLADDGKTTVIFGDGETGARLPTGQENIKAKYRKGIGLGGIVRSDQVTQLMTRPLGVKGVTNPIASSGAADAEVLADARRNAPLTVLTLGRIVSLKDYEDFARGFSGIGKALATWTWFGELRGVFVTVAGAEGAHVSEQSPLFKNLLAAMRASGDPLVSLEVKSFQPRFFRLSGTIVVDPDFLSDQVKTEVEEKLRDAFSFETREFGQPVHLSEVISAMQNVSGVVSVDVDQFHRSDQATARMPRIAAAAPQPGSDDDVAPAELLLLDPNGLFLEVAA